MDFITLERGDWEALLSSSGRSRRRSLETPGAHAAKRSASAPLTKEHQKRAGHDCGRQGHENEHAKEALRQDVKFVAKVKRDKLHQATGIHQRA